MSGCQLSINCSVNHQHFVFDFNIWLIYRREYVYFMIYALVFYIFHASYISYCNLDSYSDDFRYPNLQSGGSCDGLSYTISRQFIWTRESRESCVCRHSICLCLPTQPSHFTLLWESCVVPLIFLLREAALVSFLSVLIWSWNRLNVVNKSQPKC